MPELAQPAPRFREIARGKLGDSYTQDALDLATNRLRTNRVAAWAALPDIEATQEPVNRLLHNGDGERGTGAAGVASQDTSSHRASS